MSYKFQTSLKLKLITRIGILDNFNNFFLLFRTTLWTFVYRNHSNHWMHYILVCSRRIELRFVFLIGRYSCLVKMINTMHAYDRAVFLYSHLSCAIIQVSWWEIKFNAVEKNGAKMEWLANLLWKPLLNLSSSILLLGSRYLRWSSNLVSFRKLLTSST